jgi:hypothetical protein
MCGSAAASATQFSLWRSWVRDTMSRASVKHSLVTLLHLTELHTLQLCWFSLHVPTVCSVYPRRACSSLRRPQTHEHGEDTGRQEEVGLHDVPVALLCSHLQTLVQNDTKSSND